MKNIILDESVSLNDLDSEIKRRRRAKERHRLYRTIASSIIVVAAIAVLIATLWFPVMSVNGTSMEPIMNDGDIIVAVKDIRLIDRGDIIAFYYNDKVLLKRVIGLPGDTVNMDDQGNVFVNGKLVKEPYISKKSLGICDVQFPVTVDENSVFVLGDHRSVSVDSRSKDMGNIFNERIIGKIVWQIYPFNKLGTFDSKSVS